MASVILAGTTSTTALNLTGDTSGELQLKTNNGSTTALTLTTGGNINIPTAGARITGDFSNATLANRVAFQTSTTNGNTALIAIPNGTATTSAFALFGGNDPANAQFTQLLCVGGSDSRIVSSYNGTPTSGTYLPLTMYTGGSERLRIDTSGNVGIGTSSPAQLLDVRANATANIRMGSTGADLGNSTEIGTLEFFNSDANQNAVAAYVRAIRGGTFGSGGLLTFGTSETGSSAGTVTERMRIDSSGNLLFGVSSITGYSGRFIVGVADGNGWYSTIGSTSTGVLLGIRSSTASIGTVGATSLALNPDGGNVGIGTTSPSYKFHVANGYGFFSGANYGVLLGESNCLIVGDSGTTNAANMIFYTANTEKMRLTTGGNLLVGTTQSKARITGYGASGTIPAFFSTGFAGDVGNTALRVDKFDNNSSSSQVFVNFSVNNDGVANGQINANGASQAAFGSWSDRRLKTNIVDLSSQLEKVLALRPVEFDYIESEGGGHQISFIAQEFEEVYPDAVGERADGMKTLTGWGKTEARLVKAIQEQQAMIEELKQEVAKLKGV